ncbi:MAG: MoaD/ThiS family protein [Litorilinea sp.]
MSEDSIAIEVRIPGLLRDCTDGHGRVVVQATTLEGAVEALLAAYPRLRIHLYDEQGELRRHILLFYNQTNFKELDDTTIPLRAGDRLNVVQAVSGG